jgi:two-component system sensor histidine kinase/response regulator
MMNYHENEINTILIVDDEPNNLKVLHNLLTQNNYEVRAARNGQSAIDTARMNPPDLILLDIKMPDMNGYEVCQVLKDDDLTAHIPVIFISALNQVQDIVKAFEMGGVDYITKPFQFEEVIARVQTHLTIIRQQNTLRWQSEQLEQMRQRDKERFDKITKMRDTFVRGAAHDLKNPLTLVSGYAQMMLQNEMIRQDPDLKLMIQEIEESGSEMLNLITNMLDVLRFESAVQVERESVDLNEIVDAVVSSFQPIAASRNIDLQFETQFSSVYAMADTQAMRRVVENLVSNAIKYSPDNAEIHVITDIEADKSILQVQDKGYGIPVYDLPQIFDPFFRVESTSDKAEGTGLGLSVTKEIIEQYGGTIEVDSTEGKGSTFSVILPSQ